jgi:O-acetyl-ADP-ribose deacetylase (regulator of RNase III)
VKQQGKICFVIMPFGEKQGADGKPINFDEIYNCIIKEAIEDSELKDFGIKCLRCDEISQAGLIHEDMMEHIFRDEIAVVDVTTLNPNVFYELGVRNALRDKTTIIIRRKGTILPFNIKDLRVIDYDLDLTSAKNAKEKIIEFIKNGIINGETDSQVHKWLGERIVRAAKSKPLSETKIFEYVLSDLPSKKICLITGEILGVKVADIWVNSENTHMQMARFFDRSISSVIRYYGARRDDIGDVNEDSIANELEKIMKGKTGGVAPATVIVTDSGMLQNTNSVKKIFHAASVYGQPGKGYTPIADIGTCIKNSLRKADSPELEKFCLQSILFPLMGTGTARGPLKDKAAELIEEAIAYFKSNPSSHLDRIYFLTYTEEELDTCRCILQERLDIQEATTAGENSV